VNDQHVIMPLKDGGILSVDYSTEEHPGCETCDYGSKYIDDFTIDMTTLKADVRIDVMYEHAISENWLMRRLLSADRNMTEREFVDWLGSVLTEELGHSYFADIYSDTKITVHDKMTIDNAVFELLLRGDKTIFKW